MFARPVLTADSSSQKREKSEAQYRDTHYSGKTRQNFGPLSIAKPAAPARVEPDDNQKEAYEQSQEAPQID